MRIDLKGLKKYKMEDIRRASFVFCLIMLLIAWGYFLIKRPVSAYLSQGILADIRSKDKLTVLTRNAPTIYYEGPNGPLGFEYDLVAAFAKYLGVKLELKVLESISEIIEASIQGKGDIAAAGLTRTEEREKKLLFGPDNYIVQQVVVCRRDAKIPKKIEDLIGLKLMIAAGSSYDERLRELRDGLPSLKWDTTDDLSTEQILEKVWLGELDCTVADSNIVAINRRYYPELIVALPLSEEQPLAWILISGAKDLQVELEKWFENFKKTGRLSELRDRYYGHLETFDYVDIKIFYKRIKKRLPRLKPIFIKASQKYDLPWTLLAGQAYQESHWNENSESFTGVKGIMMLTLPTAEAVGVKDRLDTHQSIMGGAKYLSRLIKRVPVSVKGENRLRFALAAYNVGMGHIYDARDLAQQLGKNPNSWQDLKTVLPLLSQKKYYKKLKHGYARGSEPVKYVDAIYNYKDILKKSS